MSRWLILLISIVKVLKDYNDMLISCIVSQTIYDQEPVFNQRSQKKLYEILTQASTFLILASRDITRYRLHFFHLVIFETQISATVIHQFRLHVTSWYYDAFFHSQKTRFRPKYYCVLALFDHFNTFDFALITHIRLLQIFAWTDSCNFNVKWVEWESTID